MKARACNFAGFFFVPLEFFFVPCSAHTLLDMMDTTKKTKDKDISSGARREGIPYGRYEIIYYNEQQSKFKMTEAKKAMGFLVEKGYDPDTAEAVLEAIISKVVDATRHQVIADLMRENWKTS